MFRWFARATVGIGLGASMLATAHAADLSLTIRDAADHPVEDAVAWLEPSTVEAGPKPSRAAIRQFDREFVPAVTVVTVGSAIEFPNEDPMLHHVYSFSPSKTFEIKLYKGKTAAPVVFDKPGVVAIGCNIHDWMEAYVVVVPTRFHGLSTAAGTLVLRDLPADRWRLHVWHAQRKAGETVQTIDLASADHKVLPIRLDLVPREPKIKPAETTY